MNHFFLKNLVKNYLPFVLVGVLLCTYVINSWGFQIAPEVAKTEQAEKQSKAKQAKKKRKVLVESSIREELHRYLGYEELLPKYLSSPYDTSMNTNVQGSFIDISYLLLFFLPILLFLRIRNLTLRFIVATSLLSFYIISAFTGYTSFKKIPIDAVGQTLTAESLTHTFTSSPIGHIKLSVLKVLHVLYQPFNSLFDIISGEGDYFTYPLLLVFFILGAYIIQQRLNTNTKIDAAVVLLFCTYGFFWLLLSVGVIWYGILLLPFGLILMTIGYARKKGSITLDKWVSISFLTISSFWILIGYTARMANYNPIDALNSKGAINGASLMYGLGKIDKQKAMDLLYPNFNTVLAKVNEKPYSQIYRAGTFFHYFIKDNHKRVIVDNQLPAFVDYTQRFPDKKDLTAAFKRSGYKYLLIDLNLASIDNTPDKSLTKKAKLLGDFLTNNPDIQFIATDRVVLDARGNAIYSISGNNIQRQGTFAAFEIK